MEAFGGCLWCSDSSFASSELYPFLMSKPSVASIESKRPKWIEQAKHDLSVCIDCMEEYHHAVKNAFANDIRFASEKRLEMMKLVYDANVSRLQSYLFATLNELDDGNLSGEEDDDFSFASTQRALDMRKKLECSLIEIVQFPRLLLNPAVNDLFTRAIVLLGRANQLIEVTAKHPGIYLLVVHPDQMVRRWAMESVKALGLLDWDDYDDMGDVISWIINVLTFDLFNEPLRDAGDAAWNQDLPVQLPQHLFIHTSLKDYWLGLCLLVTSMDASCIRMRLVCATSDLEQLINLISSALEYEDTSVIAGPSKVTAAQASSSMFLPALQCLMVFLERLGSQFWRYSLKESESLLRAILANPFLHYELGKWQHSRCVSASTPEVFDSDASSTGDDVTDSQLVYETSRRVFDKEAGNAPLSSALNWMVPFVHSLLDFGELMVETVTLLLRWLNYVYTSLLAGQCTFELPSTAFQFSSLSDCDVAKLATLPLANELLLQLSQIVELLYAKEAAVFLLYFKNNWLPLITNAVCVSCGDSTLHKLSSVLHIVSLLISILSSEISTHLPNSKDLCTVLVGVRECMQNGRPVVVRISKEVLSKVLTSLLSEHHSLQGALFGSTLPLTSDEHHEDRTLADDDLSTLSPAAGCSYSHFDKQKVGVTASEGQNLQSVTSELYDVPASTVSPSPSTPESSCSGKRKLNLSLTKRKRLHSVVASQGSAGASSRTDSNGGNPTPSQDHGSMSCFDSSESDFIPHSQNRFPKKLVLSLSKTKKNPMLRSSESTDELNATEPSSDQSEVGTRQQIASRKCLKLKKRFSTSIVSASGDSTDECTPTKKNFPSCAFNKDQASSKADISREGKLVDVPSLSSSSKRSEKDLEKRLLPVITSSGLSTSYKSSTPPKKKRRIVHKPIVISASSSSDDNDSDFETLASTPKHVPMRRKHLSETKVKLSPRALEKSSKTPSQLLPKSTPKRSTEKAPAKEITFITKLVFKSKGDIPPTVCSANDSTMKKESNERGGVSPGDQLSYDSSQESLSSRVIDELLEPFEKEQTSDVEINQFCRDSSGSDTTLPKSDLDSGDEESEIDVTTTPVQPILPTTQMLLVPSDSTTDIVPVLSPAQRKKPEQGEIRSKTDSYPNRICPHSSGDIQVNKAQQTKCCGTIEGNNHATEELNSSEVLKAGDTSVGSPETDTSIDVEGDSDSPPGYEGVCYRIVAMEMSSAVDSKDDEETSSSSELSSSSQEPVELFVRIPLPKSKRLYRLSSSMQQHTQKSVPPLKKCSVDVLKCDQLALQELRQKILKQKEEKEERERCLKKLKNLEQTRKKLLDFKMSLKRTEQELECQDMSSKREGHQKLSNALSRAKAKVYSLPEYTDSDSPSEISVPEKSKPNLLSASKGRVEISTHSSKSSDSAVPLNKGSKLGTKLIKLPGVGYHGRKTLLEKTALASKKDTLHKGAQASSKPVDIDKYKIPKKGTPASVQRAKATTKESGPASYPLKSIGTEYTTKQQMRRDVLTPTILTSLDEQNQPPQYQTFGTKQSHKPQKFTSRLKYNLDLPTGTSVLPQPASSHTTQGGCLAARRIIPNIDLYPKKQRTMDDFFLSVLSWDPVAHLFPQVAQNGRVLVPKLPLQPEPRHVPLTFSGYEHYVEVFTPLLLLETWECVYSDIHSTPLQKPKPCVAKIISLSPSRHPHIQLLKCTALISHRQAKEYAYPSEHDLVILHFKPSSRSMYSSVSGNIQYRFALVVSQPRVQMSSPTESCKLTVDLKVCGLHGLSSSMLETFSVEIKVASSLKTNVRQWNGLINLHRSQLARDLLYPRGGTYFGVDPSSTARNADQEGDELSGLKYNHSQTQAIRSIAHSISQPFAIPRVCLLQGPPGTGKTRTVCGLIEELFKVLRPVRRAPPLLPGQQANQAAATAAARPHLLVCAPSNAGVDEIARRLIINGRLVQHSSRNEQAQQASQRGSYRVVRTGQVSRIHPDVLPVSLDELVKKNLAKSRSVEQESSRATAELMKEIDAITDAIEQQRKQVTALQASREVVPSAAEQMAEVQVELSLKESKLKHLHDKRRTMRDRKRTSDRESALVRKRILLNADIVCTTLQGSGSSMVTDCLSQNPLHFSCIIVDEASQCTELDTLIPLCLSCSKLVLVGDPMQLPATVKSQRASALSFKQSLFERVFKYFSESNPAENPIRMLTTQYRMLPEICHFPSSHFYKGKLETASAVANSGKELRFKPFMLFDVKLGTETSSNEGSICNVKECEVLLELLKHLISQFKVPARCIGVITPYKAQERRIRNEMKKSSVLRALSIDIGTVDSFQGREKAVIILSCVRANSNSGTIGFLSSRQRMNVALTRAKQAMYILAHVDSITISDDWHALVAFAKRHSAITIVTGNYSKAVEAIEKPLPPPSVPTNAPHPIATAAPAGQIHPPIVPTASASVHRHSFPRDPQQRNPLPSPHESTTHSLSDSHQLQHGSTPPAQQLPPALLYPSSSLTSSSSSSSSSLSAQKAPDAHSEPAIAITTSSTAHGIHLFHHTPIQTNSGNNPAVASAKHFGREGKGVPEHQSDCDQPETKRVKLYSPPRDPRLLRKQPVTARPGSSDPHQTTSKESSHARSGTGDFCLSDVSSASSRSSSPDREVFEQHTSYRPPQDHRENGDKPVVLEDGWKSQVGQRQRKAYASASTICSMRSSTGCDPCSIAQSAEHRRPGGHAQQQQQQQQQGRRRKSSFSSTLFGKKRH